MRLVGRRISLRPVCLDDAEFIFGLRQQPKLNRFLSTPPSSVDDQMDWISNYLARYERGEEYYFVIERDGNVPCGCVRIYNIKEGEFTWGSWVLDDTKPTKAALDSALCIYDFAFSVLGLKLCRFDVRRHNAAALQFLDRFGATRISEGTTDIFYQITEIDYAKMQIALHAALETEKGAN